MAEAYRQLNNNHYYARLDRPIYRENVSKINEVLTGLLNQGFISKPQFKFLQASESDRPRIFYLLPKIHKPRDRWPNPKMPEGRPIVSDCSSESYRVCQYIDSFVRPISTNHASYIKDTYDFVGKIRGQKIPRGAILVTGDVTSLYTNMDLDRTLTVVRQAFARHPDPSRPDPEILQLLEITLKNNDFTFNGEWFLQKVGTAMGKNYAPGLADLYLEEMDQAATNGEYHSLIRLYFRFLDDVNFVWTGSIEELKLFEIYLNSIIPGIRVALNYSATEINFLDTTIYKKFERCDGNDDVILCTKVYFKETDTHQLLHRLSFHPKHTAKGVLKSQLLRFKRISSSYADYSLACGILFDALRQRGYGNSLLRRMKREIWRTEQSIGQKNDNRPILPIIVPFNEIGTKLAREWRSAISANKIFNDNFRAITAYCNASNLRSMLVRSYLPNLHAANGDGIITDRPNTNTAAHTGLPGCTRCGSSRCRACNYLTVANSFRSSVNRKTYPIKQSLTCTSSNVVYLITCCHCSKQYVGETGGPLRDRINNHLSCIRLRKPTAIGLHFNTVGHSVSHLSILPIEQLDDSAHDSTYVRRTKETTWQNLLQTAHPMGLNNLTAKLLQQQQR